MYYCTVFFLIVMFSFSLLVEVKLYVSILLARYLNAARLCSCGLQ